ncbi:MAG: transposase, partial [Roseiflexus castenholzii]
MCKEECVWRHIFTSVAESRRATQTWLEWYNRERLHHALDYLSPQEYRAKP